MYRWLYIIILFSIFHLSGCGVLFDDPIVRFWNNGIRPSKSEMDAYNRCVRESEEIYPTSIDPNGSKRTPHTRMCMEKKGFW